MDNLAVLFDVECPIHMGPLEQGKVLPCGHEVCLSCLLFVRSKSRRSPDGPRDVVVCPTCKKCADGRQIDQWPDAKSKIATTNGKSKVKGRRSLRRLSSHSCASSTIDDVTTDLCTIESYCEETVEKLDQMILELVDMQAATVRMRHTLQDLEERSKRGDDSKQGVSIGEICTYVQKSICMLHNELFSELHNRLPKFSSAIELYRDIDLPLVKIAPELAPQTENIFQFASSLLFKLPKGDYISMASSLAKFLQNVSRTDQCQDVPTPGTWVVRAGRKNAFKDTHEDFLALDLGGASLRACLCNRGQEQVPVNKTEMRDFVEEYLRDDVDQNFVDENLALKIKCQLERETRLAWHCVAGSKDDFAAESGHPVASMCSIEVRNFRVIVWQG